MSGSDVITNLSLDRSEKLIVSRSWQDVEDIIENNKKLQSMPQKSDWGRHVASIPNNILNQWLIEEWNRGNRTLKLHSPEFDALVKKKLASNEWAWLRTA